MEIVLLEKERRRKKKTKPRCKLIDEDGNLFNLMWIASRTLKEDGMKDKADEMPEKITKSKSYSVKV